MPDSSAYSARMQQYVTDKLGMSPDDPAFRHVITGLVTASSRGLIPTDQRKLAVWVAARAADYHVQVERKAARLSNSRVYYLRSGDYIKIGTASNLRARVAQYPPGTVVLAIEQGGRDLEAQRLAQFAEHLAARKEWFHPHPDLLAHIEAIRDVAVLRAELDGIEIRI